MSIRFACSECGCRLRVDLPLAGKRIRCCECKQTVFAPLFSEDPEGMGSDSAQKAEVLGSLLPTRTGSTNKKKVRKVSITVGSIMILGAFFYLGWAYVQRAPLPQVLHDLPEGDFVVYRNRKASNFFREGKILFPGTVEIATLYRAGNGMESVSLFEGRFDPVRLAALLQDQGYASSGDVYVKDTHSVLLSPSRVTYGASWLVQEVLKVRKLQAKRFSQSLTPRQKDTWKNILPGDLIYFGTNSSSDEASILSDHTLGFTEALPGGDTGVGVSIVVEPDSRARCSIVMGGRESEIEHIKKRCKRIQGNLDSLSVSSSRGLYRFSGSFSLKQLDLRRNETRAIEILIGIGKAQENFRNMNPYGDGRRVYWDKDISGLNRYLVEGKPIELIEKNVADADFRALSNGTMGLYPRGLKIPAGGYYFLLLEGGPSSFTLFAFPAMYGRSGEHSFVMTEGRKFWRIRDKTPPPKQWTKEGWESFRP